jgi:hypothetical protein
MFRSSDTQSGRIPSLFRRGFWHHAAGELNTAADPLAFWLRCISLFHRSRDDGTYDDSLALTLLIFPLPFAPIETMRLLAFAPCLRRVHCLPSTRAKSRTSLRRDRERCVSGIKSNHLERPHVARRVRRHASPQPPPLRTGRASLPCIRLKPLDAVSIW